MTNDLNGDTLNQLTSFINTRRSLKADNRLKAALLMSDVEGTNHDTVIQHLKQEVRHPSVVITLQSRQCPNLQSSLKTIIKAAVIEHSGLNAYDEHLLKHKRLLPLNFDLELLERFTREKSLEHVIVCLSEIETFDGSTLNDLIALLRTWQDRIPFVLLLGITSTAKLFEYRLSKSCLKLLDAQAFDFLPSGDLLSSLLACAQSTGDDGPQVFLGPSVVNHLHDISQGQGKTIQALRSALGYLYMSHFFANPLSVLVDRQANLNNRSLARGIRSTDSFRAYCEELLEEQNQSSTEKVRRLLDDDNALFDEVHEGIVEGREAYVQVIRVIEAWSDLYHCLSRIDPKLQRTKFEVAVELYQSMADLAASASFYVVEACIRNLSTPQLLAACKALQPTTCDVLALSNLIREVATHDHNKTNGAAEQVNENSKVSSPSATSKKRVRTSKSNPTPRLTNESSNTSFVETLQQKLQASSLDSSSLFIHEAYIMSSPAIRFKQSFESNPRAAIERALLRPGDYLGCECCTEGRDTNSEGVGGQGEYAQQGSQPPASVLFTLLQEAPTVINVRDLSDAFQSRLNSSGCMLAGNGVEDDADSEARTKSVITQFYQALAELRMIGLVKSSTGTHIKKRAVGGKNARPTQDIDFIAKTNWAGL